MIYRDFMSLTDIGKLFGVSRRKCGQWIADLDLRIVNGSPKPKAFLLGLVQKAPNGRNETGYFYLWHRKIIKLLEEVGHRQISTPSQTCGDGEKPVADGDEAANNAELAKPRNRLIGPFDLRADGSEWIVVNRDGESVVRATGG